MHIKLPYYIWIFANYITTLNQIQLFKKLTIANSNHIFSSLNPDDRENWTILNCNFQEIRSTFSEFDFQ